MSKKIYIQAVGDFKQTIEMARKVSNGLSEYESAIKNYILGYITSKLRNAINKEIDKRASEDIKYKPLVGKATAEKISVIERFAGILTNDEKLLRMLTADEYGITDDTGNLTTPHIGQFRAMYPKVLRKVLKDLAMQYKNKLQFGKWDELEKGG